MFPAHIALLGGFAVIVGGVQAAVSNNLKLSIPHSSLFPSENTRIFKLIVDPVPEMVLVNSLKTLVSWVPSPQPLLSVSSNRYLSPTPEALPLLKKRIRFT